ncbi:MAG: CHAT domain-containing protein [Acidobacteria bacterium]|nr:CHAT domain-containing protein [Acidobacteriota bacterium]
MAGPRTHPQLLGGTWSTLRLILLLCCLGVSAVPLAQPAGPASPPAVVVAGVEPGSVAALAGIRTGDVLLEWQRDVVVVGSGEPPAAAGHIASPGDVDHLALEVTPRSRVTFSVSRDGATTSHTLPARTSRLGLTVIPRLDGAVESVWIRLLAADASPPDATDDEPFEARMAALDRPLDAAWVRLRVAERALTRGAVARARVHLAHVVPLAPSHTRLAEAVAALRFELAMRESDWDEAWAAVETGMPELPTLSRATWLLRRSVLARQRGRLEEAVADAEAAAAIRHALAPGSWDDAEAAAELGRIAVSRRRLDDAAPHFEAALALADDAPASIDRVRLEYGVADLDWRRGRLLDAEPRVRRLLELTRAFDATSAEHARNLNLYAIVRSQSGDLAAAEQAFAEAWTIHRRRAPGGADEASALNNMGIAAMQRGRYADAEAFYRRSLEMKARLKLPPLEQVSTLGNLGLMSVERRDLASARDYLGRALDLVRQAAPDSLQMGGLLSNLARVERLAGRLDDAEPLVRESLAVRSTLAPDTVLHAFTLTELGKVLEAAGALDAATTAHEQALAIRERLAPDGSNVADSLDALGRLASGRGQAEAARDLHARAGAIWRQVAPGSVYEGQNLVARARLDVSGGWPVEARRAYAEATAIFDQLTSDVGGAFDTQADFRQGLAASYTEYAEFLLGHGDPDAAFQVVERGRARVFLAQLAERDVTGAADVPAALNETRRTLTRGYERLQRELATLSPARDGARINAAVSRLRQVRLELASVATDIARQSPRLRALAPTAPLDIEGARRLLPPDTVAVAYVVGEQASHAFVLTRDAVDVFTIPWTRAALEERVARFERLVANGESDLGAIAEVGAELFTALVAPAERTLVGRARLLVVPDGALHRLPFAALVRRPSRGGRGPQYLMEWRPVHQVPSLTVYGQLTAERRGVVATARVLAVGSPLYASSDPVAQRGSDRLIAVLAALPGSQREVDALRAIYGDQTTTLSGADATEAGTRAAMGDVDILHLAVHGVVNATFPLDSALAFTPVARDDANGLLQAWEIFERVRLRARLVVLSACDTAGSRESGGEGLLGLTRAFQFAGAPSVVASLWRVPDEVTPVLMQAFHREVRRGLPIDEALANAQRAMLGRPATAHPYNWAAFILSGRN